MFCLQVHFQYSFLYGNELISYCFPSFRRGTATKIPWLGKIFRKRESKKVSIVGYRGWRGWRSQYCYVFIFSTWFFSAEKQNRVKTEKPEENNRIIKRNSDLYLMLKAGRGKKYLASVILLWWNLFSQSGFGRVEEQIIRFSRSAFA